MARKVRFNLRKYFIDTNVLVVLLLMYGTFAFVFEKAVKPNVQVLDLIRGIDHFISLVIFVYGVAAYIKAPDKKRFMRYGWIFIVAALDRKSVV